MRCSVSSTPPDGLNAERTKDGKGTRTLTLKPGRIRNRGQDGTGRLGVGLEPESRLPFQLLAVCAALLRTYLRKVFEAPVLVLPSPSADPLFTLVPRAAPAVSNNKPSGTGTGTGNYHILMA